MLPLFRASCHPSSARTDTAAVSARPPHAAARPCGPTGSRPSHQPTPPRGAGRGAGQRAAKDNEGGGGSDPSSGGAAPTHLAGQQCGSRLLPAGDPAEHALAVVAAARGFFPLGQKLLAPRAAGGRGLLARHRPSPRHAPPRDRPWAHPPSRARGVRQWRPEARGTGPRTRPRQARRAAASERWSFRGCLTRAGFTCPYTCVWHPRVTLAV